MIALSATTAVLSGLYFAINEIKNYIMKKLTSCLTIQSNDPIYKIVLDYLTNKGFLSDSMT